MGDRILHSPQRGSVELIPVAGSEFETTHAVTITPGQQATPPPPKLDAGRALP